MFQIRFVFRGQKYVITAAPMDKKATMCMSCKAPINILEGDDPTETHCNKCLLTAVISDDSDESSLQVKSVDGINPFKVHVYNSMYEHALKPHDTVVSSPLPAENIANIIKDFSNVGVDVLQLVSGTSTTTKKRILLFGSTLFKCDECNMEFEGQSSYLDHLKEVHEVTRHPKLDKEGFDQIITKLEGNNKVRLCPICKKFLVDGRQLQAHINAFHKKPVTFKCQKCNKSFKYKRTLDKHMIDFKEFKNCNYRRCKVCGEKVNRMEYEEHLKLHTGRFICENCGRDFATLISLRRHDEIKHQTKEEKHLCPICGTMYSSREYLNFHMRCHREQDEGVMYLCDQCPRSYVTRIRLMCHIKRVHASGRMEMFRVRQGVLDLQKFGES
ncbi:hypothetical protein NQ317_001136 [Molorchus minor]|uniref:C2H2-type domain-containing protein n=1 Tax=Molorchus minor TaxID=1323400 RepID=A0ABQ9J700_9CUCU|nr:hypothetical protein NQ317_001136 [Molorchus minor]